MIAQTFMKDLALRRWAGCTIVYTRVTLARGPRGERAAAACPHAFIGGAWIQLREANCLFGSVQYT